MVPLLLLLHLKEVRLLENPNNREGGCQVTQQGGGQHFYRVIFCCNRKFTASPEGFSSGVDPDSRSIDVALAKPDKKVCCACGACAKFSQFRMTNAVFPVYCVTNK